MMFRKGDNTMQSTVPPNGSAAARALPRNATKERGVPSDGLPTRKEEEVKKPSSRIVRWGRPHGVLTSEADRMKRFVLLLVAAVAVAILVGACQSQQVGEMQRESRSIQPENADSVRARLMMGAGELKVSGAADALMEGDFSYNVADWKPEVNYDISGETGELTVEQGSSEGVRLSGDARNEWDVRLNDEVPTDLVVEMGAGESDLDLDSLTLTGLDLEMGAGKTTVDLTGDYAQDFDASIEGGVGEATVLVPSEVGVRVRAEGGLGKINAEGFRREGQAYVNDIYGDSDVTLDVDVQGGVGEINLEVV
jgi:hypothetical protein